jgi:D-tyrosyl-tRNA(Tyr) deacylase
MIAVIQRVCQARVEIDSIVHSSIGNGLLILLGIGDTDSASHADWLASKIAKLRIFSDSDGKMNLDIQSVQGELLVISQFTLFADPYQGNRPSYIRAARPEKAIPLYEEFVQLLEEKSGIPVKTGVFGADMKVNLCNDGPVTITINTELSGKTLSDQR